MVAAAPSGDDVRRALRHYYPTNFVGPRKSSVAILLRHNPKSLHQLEMLFIKRAVRKGDRYSGDVAFPGGKQEPGETDLQTVVREVWEEIGINLEAPGTWQFLGRINDRFALELVVHCFVYLQLVMDSPRLKMQQTEVAACNWVPVHCLCGPSHRVCVPKRWPRARFDGRAVTQRNPMRTLNALHVPWLLGLHEMTFNAVDLPVELVETASEGNSPRELVQPGSFRLWGLTLGMVSDFLCASKLRGPRDPLPVLPMRRILGLDIHCLYRARLQSFGHCLFNGLSKHFFRRSPGVGQISRLLLYSELVAILVSLVVGTIIALRVRRSLIALVLWKRTRQIAKFLHLS